MRCAVTYCSHAIKSCALLFRPEKPISGITWFLRPCQTKHFCLSDTPFLSNREARRTNRNTSTDQMFLFPRPFLHFAEAEPDVLKGTIMTIGTVKFFNAAKGFGFI